MGEMFNMIEPIIYQLFVSTLVALIASRCISKTFIYVGECGKWCILWKHFIWKYES